MLTAADVLTAAVVELRRLLTADDRYIAEQRRAGVTIHADPAIRAHVERVITDMETLARRLLVDSIGPFIEAR
jgi:hypothetical protein